MMRALASEPDFILLDEPIAGMNDVESDALAEIFKGFAADGKGVLLIEHNVRFVAKLCSKVYVLDGGQLISEGTPDHVLNDRAVITDLSGRRVMLAVDNLQVHYSGIQALARRVPGGRQERDRGADRPQRRRQVKPAQHHFRAGEAKWRQRHPGRPGRSPAPHRGM